jgi:hypothetical protein
MRSVRRGHNRARCAKLGSSHPGSGRGYLPAVLGGGTCELDPDIDFPGLRFALLHTIAHLLIRELARQKSGADDLDAGLYES